MKIAGGYTTESQAKRAMAIISSNDNGYDCIYYYKRVGKTYNIYEVRS